MVCILFLYRTLLLLCALAMAVSHLCVFVSTLFLRLFRFCGEFTRLTLFHAHSISHTHAHSITLRANEEKKIGKQCRTKQQQRHEISLLEFQNL